MNVLKYGIFPGVVRSSHSVTEKEIECLLSMLYSLCDGIPLNTLFILCQHVFLYCTQFNLNLLFLLLKYRIGQKPYDVYYIAYIYDWCGVGGVGGGKIITVLHNSSQLRTVDTIFKELAAIYDYNSSYKVLVWTLNKVPWR